MERKVIVITGPTCSGKTSLSIKVAEKLKSEIISADSRQLYKYLDIGTAKPTKGDLLKVPHHFIDLLEPDTDYSASKFENGALQIIDEIFDKNRVPVVAGGSGLYIKALIDGIFDTVDKDEEYREELLELRRLKGNDELYNMLIKVDPESASKMIPQNWKRIIRALEVYKLSGKTIGELQKEYKRENDIEFFQYALNWERKTLYENIESRVDEMLEQGLVEETENILGKGYEKNLNSLNTVGYKEIISYLNGEFSLERAVELIKRNTRRFAKRQMTWFRADNRIKWFDVQNEADINIISSEIANLFL